MNKKQKFAPNILYCFSPPVMLFTLILETIFALYTLIFVKLKPSTVIIALILICLAFFQFTEYQICTVSHNLALMHLGFVAITLLPALGVHLITLVTKHKLIRYIVYLFATVFVGIFLFQTQSVSYVACGGNYVLLKNSGALASTYFPFYYNLSLIVAIVEIFYFTLKKEKSANFNTQKKLLYWLLGGYAAFIIPTAAIYIFSSAARDSGIPSIMCGFGIILAVILTFFVLPQCRKLEI